MLDRLTSTALTRQSFAFLTWEDISTKLRFQTQSTFRDAAKATTARFSVFVIALFLDALVGL
jgi:hypothetical protein